MPVNMTRLANGMTVVSDQMPHLKSSAVGVWVNAGSRSEEANEHGISHLLEHMAFKGTETRSAVQIVEEIESVGGDVNASTGIENTSYFVRILEEDLPLAVDILGDILANSTFDEEELEREKQVIIQEIGAAYDMPEDRVFDHILEQAFPDQPLGRPILGTPETVQSFSSFDIDNYMATHYHGPNMILAAAGAVRHEDLVELGEKAFASFSMTPPKDLPIAHYRGGESRDVQKDLMEAQVVLGFEGRPFTDDNYYVAQLLAAIMGGGMSSRLFQEVREKRGLCYSIYTFHWGFVDSGLFGIHAATAAEHLEELMPVMIDELTRVIDDLTPAELNRARAQIKAGLLMGTESPSSRASQLSRQVVLYGRPRLLEEMEETVADVSVDDVKALAEKIFCHSVPTLSSVGPVRKLMRVDEVASRLGSTKPRT
ncbi:M16 family metallopeptidase [Cohaesibacter haloalkalitolerans]|uniref:M16 family metallopeptidase n=1 Tax=Cohaesibacter haloalkalitolerans TaxID=1162980 RepID=UPI0013C51C3F|nr:pitrilysin family protein [Cohaesibacter haloalkalitolerans]